jgi:hypothetical protein
METATNLSRQRADQDALGAQSTQGITATSSFFESKRRFKLRYLAQSASLACIWAVRERIREPLRCSVDLFR